MRMVLLVLVFCAPAARDCVATEPGEVLYNGIQLPQEWPPEKERLTREPMPVPYLEHPPTVIPIDVGRQLFVDDFLIEQTTLQRTFHQPQYHPANPILRPDKPWEHEQDGPRQGPVAMPFSDGVWFDPQDDLFKMWYLGDYGKQHICYATSRDGIHWDKPSLDVVPGTNIVFLTSESDSRMLWHDLEEHDPTRRYKLFITQITRGGEGLIGTGQDWYGEMDVHFSPDGIHWSQSVARSGRTKERNTVFLNPFRKVWVFSLREYLPPVGSKTPERARRYWESTDLIANLPFKNGTPTMWVGADDRDLRGKNKNLPPELYNLDAVAYESLLVGLFSIHRDYADVKQMRLKSMMSALVSAETVSIGIGLIGNRSCQSPKSSGRGIGVTYNRPAAVFWSWATSSISTSADARAMLPTSMMREAAPAWRHCAGTASHQWMHPRLRANWRLAQSVSVESTCL